MATTNATLLRNRKGETNGKIRYEIIDNDGERHTRTSTRVYNSAAIIKVESKDGRKSSTVVYSSKAFMDEQSALTQAGYTRRAFSSDASFEDFKKNRAWVTCVRF